MLDDHTGGSVEQLNGFECGVRVGNIVVRELFTLQLLAGGNGAGRWVFLDKKGAFLVRVFTVAQSLYLLKLAVKGARKIFAATFDHTTKIVGNRAVVGGGVLVGFNG